LNAVYDEAFARFGKRLGAVVPTGDPLADLAALGLAYRESALAEPHFLPGDVRSACGVMHPEPETMERGLATFKPLLDTVRRAIDLDLLRDEDPVTIAASLWATVHGMVSLELRALLPDGSGDPAELYLTALRAMGYGWRATSGAHRPAGTRPPTGRAFRRGRTGGLRRRRGRAR